LIGRRVAHYAILDKLGEGGMAVVWKAEDLRLKRTVALKFLKSQYSETFEREARAIAAVNHPNVCTLHDVGLYEGQPYLVMEFVDGKPLTPPLSVKETLKVAIQIGAGLAAAHAKGIAHRDLKPSNVMVTDKGFVKVLDFGVAKLADQPPAPDQDTLTLHDPTAQGHIVGTAAYMSPEQAQGKSVDPRSDIFSFGSLLYEMVTGRRAFEGDSTISMIAAIVEREPSPMGPGVPGELERITRKCLRKDPERRFQHIEDAKSLLEDVKEDFDSGALTPVGAQGTASVKRLLPFVVACSAVLAAIAAGLTWWLMRTSPPATPPILTRLTSDPGLTTDPALSPDGKLLAYASDRSGDGNLDIWVRQVGGGEPIRLTRDPADDREPAFSPDGTKIVFRSERDGGGIHVVSALGSPARKIATDGRRPRFSPDGEWIAYGVGWASNGVLLSGRNQCRIYIVPVAGGTPRQLRADFAAAAFPVWTPDGKHLLFLGNRDEKLPANENIDWWVTPLDTGPAVKTGALEAARAEKLSSSFQAVPSALVPSGWEPGGEAIVFSARYRDSTNLWRIGISPDTWKVNEPPKRLTWGLTLEEMPSVASVLSGVTQVVFASVAENVDIYSLPIEATRGKAIGTPRQLTYDLAVDFHPALSPDESRMAFVSGRTGHQEIWLKDFSSGEESVLTSTRANKYLPRFSLDGSRVSYTAMVSQKQTGFDGFVIPAVGGTAEHICVDCGEITDWAPDGRHVIGNSVYGRVYLLDLASHRLTELVALPERWLAAGYFSPDGRWITLVDARVSRGYIASFRGETRIDKDALIDVGETRGTARWSPDGAMIYAVAERDGYRCFWAQRLNPLTKHPLGPPFALFHIHTARRSLANQSDMQFVVTDQKLVFSMGERTGNIWMAEFKH
jgi:Tol biopolymer transport system component